MRGYSNLALQMQTQLKAITIVSAAAIIAFGLVSCTHESAEHTSIPTKSVLIVDSRSRGHENPALRAEYDSALRIKFADISKWPTVHMSSMDKRLDGDMWDQTMEENGFWYFLTTRITLDKNGLLYVTATITDRYMLNRVWKEQYVGTPQEIASLAAKVANYASEVLGEP